MDEDDAPPPQTHDHVAEFFKVCLINARRDPIKIFKNLEQVKGDKDHFKVLAMTQDTLDDLLKLLYLYRCQDGYVALTILLNERAFKDSALKAYSPELSEEVKGLKADRKLLGQKPPVIFDEEEDKPADPSKTFDVKDEDDLIRIVPGSLNLEQARTCAQDIEILLTLALQSWALDSGRNRFDKFSDDSLLAWVKGIRPCIVDVLATPFERFSPTIIPAADAHFELPRRKIKNPAPPAP